MVFWFVIGFNGLLTLGNVYLVLHLWRLLQILRRITKTLDYLESRLGKILSRSHLYLLPMPTNTVQLKRLHQQLGKQFNHCRPLLLLALLGWRYYRRHRSPSLPFSMAKLWVPK
jgi:hypothetical protein